MLLRRLVSRLNADEAELTEAREQSVKVASKRHESAMISEQTKLIDLQTLLDSREEAGYFLSTSPVSLS